MKEIQIMPASLGVDIDKYFVTTTEYDTLLRAPGIGPCIGGLFTRKGHLGLGHFDPDMDAVMRDLSGPVKRTMESEGSGSIGCRLYTGESFATRSEFGGKEGVERYVDYVGSINQAGFSFNEHSSRTYILANEGISLPILLLSARFSSPDLDRVLVGIQYFGEGTSGAEAPHEVFEIDTETNQFRVITPFTGRMANLV